MSTPITVLTGFLGSGKTTLLNRLVREPTMGEALVLVNEAGEASIDHHLVEEVSERMVVLPSGCVCCAVRDDLVEVLANGELLAGRSHVLLETTGLADPTPLVGTILRSPELAGRVHLARVLVTLDATRGASILQSYPEAAKQLALADAVVITKCDEAEETEVREAEALGRSFAPEVELLHAIQGVIQEPVRSLERSRHVAPPPDGPHVHTHGIRTFVVESASRASLRQFSVWHSMMSRFNGERLLRLKGLVRVEDHDEPVVVQSVQHVVYPTYTLAAWPEPAPKTQLVGITHEMPERLFQDVLRTLRDIVGPQADSPS